MKVNQNAQYDDLADYARKGQWEELLKKIDSTGDQTQISLQLLKIQALRATGAGEVANKTLVEFALNQRECPVSSASALAEELIQCSYFKLSQRFIDALERSEHPSAYFLRASQLREEAKYADALKALSRLKTYSEFWFHLAQLSEAWIRIRQAHLRKAEECLEGAQNDSTIATQKLIARFELASGQLEKAVQRLELVANRQPFDWEWPHLLASASLSLGKKNLADAIELVELGIRRQPRHAESWALLAMFKLSTGLDDQALKCASQALAIKPWLDTPVTPFIENHVSKRKFKEAGKFLKNVLRLADTPRRQAIALDLMRLEGARKKPILELATKLSEQFDNESDVLRSVAAAYISLNQRDLAAPLLEKIIERNPYDLATKNNLAALYKERGDLDDAIRLWSQLAKKGELSSKLNLAQAYTERGDYDTAKHLWTEIAQAKNREDPRIYRGFAHICVRQGDLNKSLEYVEQACLKEPSNAKNWLLKASLTRQLESAAKACDLLESVIQQVDTPVELRKELVRLWRIILIPGVILRRISEWISENPAEISYYLLYSSEAERIAEYSSAEEALRKARDIDESLGTVELVRYLLRRAKYSEAKTIAEQWAQKNQTDIRPWAQLAEVCFLENDPEAALDAINNALAIEPLRSSLIRQKIGVLLSLERFSDAELCARLLWEHNQEYNSFSMLLRTIERQQHFDRASILVREVLERDPKDTWLRLRYARQLRLKGDTKGSIFVLEQLYNDLPESDLAAKNLIATYLRSGDRTGALKISADFSSRFPDRADLQLSLSEILMRQGLVPEARKILDYIRNTSPEILEAWISAALVERHESNAEGEKTLWRLIAKKFPTSRWARNAWPHWLRLGMEKEFEKALNEWRMAEPNNAEPWWIAYSVATKLSRYVIAMQILDGVERRTGRTPNVLAARATAASEQYKMSAAERYITEACNLSPTNVDFLERKIAINLKSGNWSEFDQDFNRLCYLLSNQKFNIYERLFFNLNCHPSWQSSELFKFYQDWGRRLARTEMQSRFDQPIKYKKDRKIRVGYISPDFRKHVVAKFTKPILEHHERKDFELFGYAHLENETADSWTKDFQQYFDHWREIQFWSMDELENKIRADSIDILVDLAGHTSNNKLELFLRRVAPIQASHIVGAGQTTGLPCVDYLVTSDELWPKEEECNASEKIERIKHRGIVFDIPEDALAVVEPPSLKHGRVLFGVFARPLRVNYRCISMWSKILKAVPNSVIRFEHAPYLESDIQARFIEMFSGEGIDSSRVEFRHTRPYWRAFQEIDIQLDPFPAGSGSTATEGLYMGRPVITKIDRPAMGRATHAQLVALELDEICSARTDDEYVVKAINLASNSALLQDLSRNLRSRFLASPIVYYEGYAKELASTYRKWMSQFYIED
jgi:protein O-GlcNAc transferase